jgi:Na+-driven multidrug efflux pump
MSNGSGLENVKGTRKVLKFALPTIIMMVLTSSYVMVDGLIVANLIGTDALAAANLTMPVYSLFTAVGFMFASGGSALVSKKMGEGRTAEAR